MDHIISTYIDQEEIVEYAERIKELADIFIAQNKILKVCQILHMSNVLEVSESFKVCY